MFIVEDGTGIPEANAYADIPYAENYLMGDRLTQFTGLSGVEKEANIIAATQLVDISFEWLGKRKTFEQGLAWPRTGVELDGFMFEGIPSAVKKATCEAVWLVITEGSLFSTENNKEVARERVEGAVDIHYVNPKDIINPAASRFEILNKLLKGLYGADETPVGGSSVGSMEVARV